MADHNYGCDAQRKRFAWRLHPRLYTAAAYSQFEETKGRAEGSEYADFLILSTDLTKSRVAITKPKAPRTVVGWENLSIPPISSGVPKSGFRRIEAHRGRRAFPLSEIAAICQKSLNLSGIDTIYL